jgi:Family of unknown function (DUF6459)
MLPSVTPALRAHLDPAEADRRDQRRAHARAGLPDPRMAAARVVLAVCEVEAGQRPVAQLERVCHHTLYQALTGRIRRGGGPAVTSRSLVDVLVQEHTVGLVQVGGAGPPWPQGRRGRAGARRRPWPLAGRRAAVLSTNGGSGPGPAPPWRLPRGCPQPARPGLASRCGAGRVRVMTQVEQLVAAAMTHATDTFDDEAAIDELRQLADGGGQALERAITDCMAQPASLATRRRAIELLARIRYEDPPAT